nr:Blp family class II bacteriocin [Bacillus subtilis]
MENNNRFSELNVKEMEQIDGGGWRSALGGAFSGALVGASTVGVGGAGCWRPCWRCRRNQ